MQTNLQSRAAAKKHLLEGGCLIVFPAGGVSTTPTPWHKRAVDTEWKTFTARLIGAGESARGARVLRRPEQPHVPARQPYQH